MDIPPEFYEMFPNIQEHEFRRLMRTELLQEKIVQIWASPPGKRQDVFLSATRVQKGEATLLATIKDGILTKVSDFVPGPPLPEKPAKEQASHVDTQYWKDFSERALWLGANRINIKVIQSSSPKGQKEALNDCSLGVYLTDDPSSHWTIQVIIAQIVRDYGPGSYELTAYHKDWMWPIFSAPMDVRILEVA